MPNTLEIVTKGAKIKCFQTGYGKYEFHYWIYLALTDFSCRDEHYEKIILESNKRFIIFI